MPISAPGTEDPPSSPVAASSPNPLGWESSGFPPFGGVPAAGGGASVAPEPASEAFEKKRASQQALEKGKLVLSIELGERAVELDPTDADSWLILGAAYLQRGDIKNARRCFSSCVGQATSGQRKECAAMLR
jgi:tetratricopeptide (TPR) repeat protein